MFDLRMTVIAKTSPNPLEVPLIKSGPSQWCWAACAEMLFRVLLDEELLKDDFPKRCKVAKFLTKDPDCCDNPFKSQCNVTCKTSDVKAIFDHWKVKSTPQEGPLRFETLQAEIIDEGRAVEAEFNNGERRHVVILRGAREINKTRYVDFNDPESPKAGTVTYEELFPHETWGKWTYSWFGISV